MAGLNLVSCCKSTLANCLSYWLDLKGPSYVVDTACSASCYAIALAYYNLISDKCEGAIVAGENLCLLPLVTLQFARLGIVLLK